MVAAMVTFGKLTVKNAKVCIYKNNWFFCAIQIGCFGLIISTSLSHHFKWNTVLIWRNALFSKSLNVNLLECHPGYIGPNCTIQCPYPTYGELCQGYCNCRKENCDVSTGCRAPTTGIYTI